MSPSSRQPLASARTVTVGVFDSGVGGLTVAAAIVKRIPWARVIYFGDSARVPYGNKSKANIIAYSEECVSFLICKGADLVVVACNTSSAVAINHLRKKFSQLPIIGVVDPGVISAITALQQDKTKLRKDGITVAATYRTASSHIYRRKIQSCKQHTTVYEVPCPLLVPIIEEGMKNKAVLEPVLKKYLQTAVDKSGVLLLGCTHYPLIKNVFKKIFSQVTIVDSAETTAYYLDMLLRVGKISLTNLIKPESYVRGLEKLPLAKMVFSPPVKNKQTKPKKTLTKSRVAIYTNDRNEVFVHIAKKLFPQTSVRVGKLK